MNNKYNKIIDYIDIYRRNKGYSSKKIGVAVADTGVYLHNDIAENVIAFKDCVNGKTSPYDDNGHGTHVAGIIAGRGKKYRGINPNAGIIGLKVLGKNGNGKTSYVLKGIEYILENRRRLGIRIMNISVGGNYNYKDYENNVLLSAVEKVWEAGIVVVAAAGNNGPKPGSITVPGVSKKIITVGSCDDIFVYGRTDNKRKENTAYSGRGPTCNCIVKPDIICPGNRIISLKNNADGYVEKSGTSMATPIVSGIISIMLEKEPDMTPKDVKLKLIRNAMDIGYDRNIQGYGEINIEKLLK